MRVPRVPLEYTIDIPQVYQKYSKNISKDILDISKISKISKISTKYKAAAGQAQPKPGPSPGPRTGGPGPRGPGLRPGLGRAGPAAAWYFVLILDTSWIYFDFRAASLSLSLSLEHVSPVKSYCKTIWFSSVCAATLPSALCWKQT